MSFSFFSFYLQMPFVSSLIESIKGFLLPEWYDKLFRPHISIAFTAIVCLIVIWIIGILLDNLLKNQKFLLAIIKTIIIGVILYNFAKITSPEGGWNRGDGQGSQSETEGTTPTIASKEELPLAPVAREPINDIIITCTKEGVTISSDGKEDEKLTHPKSDEIFKKLKSYLNYGQCFGTIAIKNMDIAKGAIAYLEELLRGYHNLQNNTTDINIIESEENSINGDEK